MAASLLTLWCFPSPIATNDTDGRITSLNQRSGSSIDIKNKIKTSQWVI
jgi:hypothetical protein